MLKFALLLSITILRLLHVRQSTWYVTESTSSDSSHWWCFICVRIYDSVLPGRDDASTGNQNHTLDVTQSPHFQGSAYPRRFFEHFYFWKWRQYAPRKVRIRLPKGAASYSRTTESLLKWSKTLRIHTFTFNIPLYRYSTISPLRLNHIENYHIKLYTTKLKKTLRLKTVHYANHTLRIQSCYSK